MTLVQWRHFVVLAQTGSFSRAAEALFLTQPALSRSLMALEEELGQPLFDRIGRRNELTPFGRDMLTRAQALCDLSEDLREAGRAMQEGVAGSFRIGLGSGPGAMLTRPLLQHVAQYRPQLALTIARGSTERLVQSLRERSLDALVVDARSLSPAPDLHCEVLTEMQGAFLCRPGHPLTQGGPWPFEALLRFPLASTPLSEEVARLLVERYGPQAHPEVCLSLRCDELTSLVEVTRSSDAVLLAIRAAALDLQVVAMNPPLAATARFGLVVLAGRTPASALAVLKPLLAQCLQDQSV